MKHWIFGIAAAAMVFSLAGCDLLNFNKEDEQEQEKPSGVDFTSHNTDYSILVRNNTGERLVAFKGGLQADTLIGGIPAHAQNHGLPYRAALFDKTEDFPLILLTEAQYNANKGNLQSQKNTPFTRVYVFYNKSGDNTVEYELAAGLGGNNELSILNSSSSMNIELRLGGVAGETIGYAPGGILETKLYLNDGNYNVFPVFKHYNKSRDVVETVYPKGTSGLPWYRTVSFGEETLRAYTFNLRDLLHSVQMTSGAAWIVVQNQTESGVRFLEGGSVHKTASGLENVMTSMTFQIDMPKAPGTDNYADSREVLNWKFGPTGAEVPLLQSSADSAPLTSLTIERDKMYTIVVTGDHNQGTLKAYLNGEPVEIDVSDFHF